MPLQASADMNLAVQKAFEQAQTSLTDFHFGTGDHHDAGLANMRLSESRRRQILAITASAQEYKSYMKLLERDSTISRWYHVLYGDAFQLNARLLPPLDSVALFRVGEHSKHASQEHVMIKQVIARLKLGGKVLLSHKSRTYQGNPMSSLIHQEFLLANEHNRSALPLVPGPASPQSAGEFYKPGSDCERDVVPTVYSHKTWGYIYHSYCRHYKGGETHDACKGWFIPHADQNFLGIGSMQDADTLLIVSHPDDELIFGGGIFEPNASNNKIFIVYATNDFKRVQMASQAVRELGLAGGQMIAHGDSNLPEVRADYRLYMKLATIMRSKPWRRVITHEAAGEYGHPFHKIMHKVVNNLVVENNGRRGAAKQIEQFSVRRHHNNPTTQQPNSLRSAWPWASRSFAQRRTTPATTA